MPWSPSLRLPYPKLYMCPSPPPAALHVPPISFSRFYQPHNFGWGVQIMYLFFDTDVQPCFFTSPV
jgi:hypothetical protein